MNGEKKNVKERWYPFCSQKCAAIQATCDFRTSNGEIHWCSLTNCWEYCYKEDCECSKGVKNNG